LVEILEAAMLRNPVHWRGHYHGDEQQQAHARKFSLSDRARYYWPVPSVRAALETLLNNLHQAPIPLTLLQQVLPRQYDRIREGKLESTPEALITDQIRMVLHGYDLACGITRHGRE
jgi:D-tagatose-1,6-bisphosphate aldolase subunit GatZ/KbaZ